jgi:hypothetical protein
MWIVFCVFKNLFLRPYEIWRKKSFKIISIRKINCLSSCLLGMSFYFSEIMEKDLARFHSGADFLFLFHLG